MQNFSLNTVPWSNYRSQITEVVFNSNILNVGNYSFNTFSKINRVYLSEDIETIGVYAFRRCSSLKTIQYMGTSE